MKFLRNNKFYSKYCFHSADKWYKRLVRWLYQSVINEPYIPEGKIAFIVTEKGRHATQRHEIQIKYRPKKYVPGVLEDYFWENDNCEITLFKTL